MSQKVVCLNCHEVIQSCHVHDFSACKCYIDSSKKLEDCAKEIFNQLRMDDANKHQVRCILAKHFMTGCTIDGGDEYLKMSVTSTSYKVIDEEQQ